ncbi:sensor histidine kinase [Pseudoalteromonas citrea]|uniref:histidine kinase n=1 Tax=Pseudoalteromonas citrea TaxID=43655 RepID=A0A5S3XNZ0_9GAMM|nr:HAMP domain-containing sensor histidine kinase [Pseudoalteromonas citrea]TMP41589.1 sensor histidine kinase [Pseudoalteromonas citrea]TMP55996.1 sensor histidine kinase [Pseudoalteromonas citrea]
MQLRHSVLLFKGAALISAVVVCAVSWFLYCEITNGIKLERKFSELESAISRIISQKERYIVEREKHIAQGIEPLYLNFQDNFNQLLILIIDEPEQVEQLVKVDEKVKEFKQIFTQFEQSQTQLGYSENDGVYGEFRYHAHQLQSVASKASLTDLEILVLELRRAEKDYLLRFKPHYLTLHQQYFEKATYLVKTAQPERAAINLQYLAKYQHGFLEYVALIQQQGLTHKQGLRAALNQNIEEIKTQRKVLSEGLLNARHNNKLSLILYDLSAIVLISVFCLILLNYLNNRVSKHILKIKQVLQQVTEGEDFSIRTNLQGEDEIAQIGHHLDGLFHYIETLLARLSAAQARLIEEAKIASLGNMVSGFAHELNTPLGIAITSQSHLKEQVKVIKGDLESGVLQKQALTKLISEAESALFLLENNLLRTASLIDDFKKVAVHQQYDDINEFNLRTLVMGVFDCYQSELVSEHYSVECEIPENLVLTSYPAAFSQILSYCINNCIKHGKVDNKPLNIVVSAMVVNDFVHFYFKDDGNGIDKELIPVIFEPFITTKRHDGGTGLGLSIVYNLVTQKLKGEVKMQSPAHGGACLHIILENTPYTYDVIETFEPSDG